MTIDPAILPYGKTAGGQLQVIVDPRELPQTVRQAREALDQGRRDQALSLVFGQARAEAAALFGADPPRAHGLFVLAGLFIELGHGEQAKDCLDTILARCPHPLVWYELGRLYTQAGFLTGATACRRTAVRLAPDEPEFRVGLALDLVREGQIHEGISLLRQAVDQDPLNAELRSKLLFHLHHAPGVTRQELFEEHRRWGRLHAPASMARRDHDRDPDPDRRLRIGYVSSDLRRHSVTYMFEAVLDGRDRTAVEVFGYGHVPSPDATTRRLASKFDGYRPIHAMDDPTVADLIEQDRIDILVGVTSHTEGYRWGVFARKPAPIQVDYQSINTTGMGQMDYRFTDACLDPPGSQDFSVEQLVALPGGVHCFTPPNPCPPVAPLAAERNGFVTFGSFNKLAKINAEVLAVWARVLTAVPGSRLLLKGQGAEDPGLRARLAEGLRRHGVSADRVGVKGRRSWEEHLSLFGQVDILLDCLPFNGCITTMEGLWMGVPTLSLVGEPYVSRMGLSLLTSAGLPDFALPTAEALVDRAVALTRDLRGLAGLRSTLRERLIHSPLLDARAHVRALEEAYRQMWHRWCSVQTGGRALSVQDTGVWR